MIDPKKAADIYAFADDQFRSLCQNNALLEITENVDEIIEANGGKESAAVKSASYDGKLYAYPMTASNGYFLYYNKEYFTEEDVKSFDRMLEIAEKNDKKFLEDFSKRQIMEPIKALTDIFLDEWLSYEERLSVFKINEENMENEKKFSASAILDFLSSLDAAMEDMDVDTADEIIKQIQCYEMPDNLKELTDQLASAVMNLDIQMEHEIVKKLREEMKTS